MSTPRQKLSSESSQPVEMPGGGNITPEQTAKESLTHWVMTFYKDINNMGPIEIKSQLGYRDQRWTEFKRCTPYPLGNLTSYEPDREAGEASTSMTMNAETLPKLKYTKTAQAQAAELGASYGDEGLRVLVPLIGMDDFELVKRIIQVVQPFQYAIHEMAYEFSQGAELRIQESNLSDGEKQKARELAKVMLSGAGKAETKALAEYEALISSMSEAAVGKPGISNPNKFHEWICLQLNKPVPERINRMAGQSNNNDAINILANRALKEESAAEAMAEQLEAERAERRKLEEKVNQLLAAQEPKSGKQQPRA